MFYQSNVLTFHVTPHTLCAVLKQSLEHLITLKLNYTRYLTHGDDW